jgi:hypothetical protein
LSTRSAFAPIAAAIAAAIALSSCDSTSSSAGAAAGPDLSGIWSGYLTTETHPYWRLEDIPCFPGCPVALRQRVADLVSNPDSGLNFATLQRETGPFLANYAASVMTPEGLERLQRSSADAADLETFCEPYGLLREAMNPLPMRIRDEGERIVIDYEEWSLTRTIHLDGDDDGAAEPTALGYSVGRFESDALVVETTSLTSDYYPLRMGSYSEAATIHERYVVRDEPRRLELELTITDPVTLKEPYVWMKTWLHTPDVELLEDSCEDIPGEL